MSKADPVQIEIDTIQIHNKRVNILWRKDKIRQIRKEITQCKVDLQDHIEVEQ